MQWDIRYAENSAQADYLKQFELLQEDEVQPHLLDLPEGEDFNFLENKDDSNQEESQTQQKINFASYLSTLLWAPNLILKKKAGEIVLLMFGDLVEQSYLNNNYQWIKIRRGIFKDLGLLLLILFYWPFLIIPLFFIFFYLPSEGLLVTQTQLNQDLRKRLIEIAQKIKMSSLKDKEAVKIQLLCRIVRQIEARFQLTEIQSERAIDRLDEVVHTINIKSISKKWQKNIRQIESWFHRKIVYFGLKQENSRFQQAIFSLQSVLKLKESDNIKAETNKKLPTNIYYSIFINRMAEAKTGEEKKTLFSILRRQIDYRQVYHLRHLVPLQKEEFQHEQLDTDSVVEEIVKQKIEDSLCYQDQNVQNYEPEDSNTIKLKLEELLKQQVLKKIEKEEISKIKEEKSKKNQQEESPIPSFLSQMKKNQRFSFGIAIAPPVRDMSAYYIS